MILKSVILGLLISVVWLGHAEAASFSKVYVQNGGSEPVNFVKYGAPGVLTDQIARLSAPPIGSVLPVPNVIPPCVSPCVLPNQNIAQVVPFANNAKFVTYDTPSLPVVVSPTKDNGYEYSYIVYDENTGDHKAQRESSDGAVVRGEYSFIQPDGYVREVTYRADDLTGFNVIVKNILPDAISKGEKAGKKPGTWKKGRKEKKDKKEKVPCDDKKGALKAQTELIENGPGNLQDIELNIAKPKPTKASPVPEKKTEVIKGPEAKLEPIKAPAKTPESEKPKETVLPLKEAKKEETTKVKESNPVILQSDPRSVVAYDDIIRCIQSKIQRPTGPLTANISPLTYIILPGGPC